MKMGDRAKNIRRKLVILLAIICVAVFLFANKNFQAIFVLRREIARMEKRIEKAKQENLRLKEELEALRTDPEYIETMARRELGLIKPGEIKYKFVPSSEED